MLIGAGGVGQGRTEEMERSGICSALGREASSEVPASLRGAAALCRRQARGEGTCMVANSQRGALLPQRRLPGLIRGRQSPRIFKAVSHRCPGKVAGIALQWDKITIPGKLMAS